jgi:NTP pyrophosphatase (non-canonical NTP hydrolase)
MTMTFADYQERSRRTLNNSVDETKQMINYALGLAGEAGELINVIKKHQFHAAPLELTETRVRDEMGDVLWYLAAIASWYSIDLAEVAAQNIEKLERRYPDGFRPLNRKTDVDAGG